MKLRAQFVLAIAALAGLSVFAAPAAAADNCGNAAIRAEQNSAFLPDCRAYEMVTPPDKVGGQADSKLGFAVSESGDKMVYQSLQAFADSVGAGVVSDYLATRGPDGWATRAISPRVPSEFQAASTHFMYSPDLSRGLLYGWPGRPPVPPLTPDTPESPRKSLFLTDISSGSHTLITKSAPQFGLPLADWFEIAAADRNLERVLFMANEIPLTPDASPGEVNTYEWHSGEVRLVGILPDSACESPPCIASSSEPAGGRYSERAMPEDGSRAFFQTPTGAGSAGLYVREGGTTRQIGDNSAYFLSATKSDGSRVLFYDLTCGLCILDLESDETTKVNVDSEPADFSGFAGVVGANDDLSRVYFGDSGQLIPGEGQPGLLNGSPANMYSWHDGELRYVGHFDTAAGRDNVFNDVNSSVAGGDIARANDSDLTPDGTRLVLTSFSRPTGYDNVSLNCRTETSVNDQCEEVYAYDALANGGEGELRCLSCNPDGATGASTLANTFVAEPLQFNSKRRNISDDGRVAFFETFEPLAPGDANATLDVYAYYFASGELRLISTGTGTSAASFAGIDSGASTAFFTTLQPLVRRDVDAASDLYAARIGGGFADPVPAPSCLGEDCQGGSAPTPPALAPASQGLIGPGNARQRPQKKKQQKKNKGKCVKRGQKGKGKAGGKAAKRSFPLAKKTRCAKAKGGK